MKDEDVAKKAEGGTSLGQPRLPHGRDSRSEQVQLWLEVGKVYVMASPEWRAFWVILPVLLLAETNRTVGKKKHTNME